MRVKGKQQRVGRFFTPSVVISLAVLAVILIGVLFAGVLAPYDPNYGDLSSAMQGPSAAHLLGTDQTGRDLFSRMLYGGGTTLLGALGVVAFAVALGVPLGLFSGYYGGWVDTLVLRVSDIVISFPSLLLAFVFVAAFGRGFGNTVVALGILYIPMTAKLTRSLVLMERGKTYVEAARAVGCSDTHILFLEIFPNCASTLTAQLTLDFGYAILDLAAMSFIGLGVQPPTSDWGAMLEEGQVMLFTQPLLALAPGIAIAVTVIALNIFSDGVQRYIDPSQRQLPGFGKRGKWGKKAD